MQTIQDVYYLMDRTTKDHVRLRKARETKGTAPKAWLASKIDHETVHVLEFMFRQIEEGITLASPEDPLPTQIDLMVDLGNYQQGPDENEFIAAIESRIVGLGFKILERKTMDGATVCGSVTGISGLMGLLVGQMEAARAHRMKVSWAR